MKQTRCPFCRSIVPVVELNRHVHKAHYQLYHQWNKSVSPSVELSKPEPQLEKEPVLEPEVKPLPDLKTLSKDELLDLAGEYGLSDKVHYTDTVSKLRNKLKKLLK